MSVKMRVKDKKRPLPSEEKGSKSKNATGGSNLELKEAVKPEMFNPEDFLSANDKISILSLDLLKKLYDFTKSSENKKSLEDPLGLQTASLKTTPLLGLTKTKRKKNKRQNTISKAEAPVPTLITEDFDEDQIWEEVELQNGLMYDNLVTSVSKLLAYQEKSVQQEQDSGASSEEEEHELENDNRRSTSSKNVPDEDDDSDFFESDEKYRKKGNKQGMEGKQYTKSIVDDKFFSLAQMTEHIEQVEAEMEKAEAIKSGELKDDEDESDEEDQIDMFEEMPSDDDESEKQEAQYFYQDFFDPPLQEESNNFENSNTSQQHGDSGQDDLKSDEEPSFDKPKAVRFNLEEDEDGGDDQKDDEDEEDDEALGEEEEDEEGSKDKPTPIKDLGKKINETLSTFEKRKKKIEESIEEIENEALKPKAWQLLGEAKADNRPENALLEEHLIYDHMIRPAPEITVETTLRLEDVIKQRIKDGAWDDVQRKVRPIEDPREYKKRLVLDAEKSKASLAEIYEQEYLDKKKAEDGETEEKEPEEHDQIKKDLQSLFQKLDALSHFHFTPKAPTADIKIVSNMPSISIEETAGVSVSDANMLAPQEIQEHAKGAIKGKEERSDSDRKRERRKKKKTQHLKRLNQEEKARLKGLGLRNLKLAEGIVKSQQKAKKAAAEEKSGDFTYSTSKQNPKELKSSKAFFSKLQESATSHIDKVAKRKNRPNETDRSKLSAKKFKL